MISNHTNNNTSSIKSSDTAASVTTPLLAQTITFISIILMQAA